MDFVSANDELISKFTPEEKERVGRLQHELQGLRGSEDQARRVFDHAKFESKGPKFSEGRAISGDRILFEYRITLRSSAMTGDLIDFTEFIAKHLGAEGYKAGKESARNFEMALWQTGGMPENVPQMWERQRASFGSAEEEAW